MANKPYIVNLYGWISPDCDCYSCGYMEHISLAADLVKQFDITSEYTQSYNAPDEALLEAGWLKVDREGAMGWPNKVTQKQMDFCLEHDIQDKFNLEYIVRRRDGIGQNK